MLCDTNLLQQSCEENPSQLGVDEIIDRIKTPVEGHIKRCSQDSIAQEDKRKF